MKAIMVGGGTGGHIYPAIAVAEAIQSSLIESQILFVGSEEGIEMEIVPKERFTLSTIKARGMLRKLSMRSISAPFMAVAGFFDAYRIIKDFKPDVIVATGGFVSLPVVVAGFFLRVPAVLLESNVVPGITTRICKWFAARIVISFEASRKYFRFRKVFCLGVPVRKQIISAIKGISIQNMGLRQDLKIVLILEAARAPGPSTNALLRLCPRLEKLNVQVVHISGTRDHDQIASETSGVGNFYRLLPYMTNIWDGLASSDLVVTRAGAAAISEIVARGLPSIIVPFPFSSERHQDFNAKVLVDAGAAVLIKDSELSGKKLSSEIKRILDDRPLYLQMSAASKSLGRPNAASEIVSMISNMLGMDLSVKKRKRTIAGKRKKT